MDNLMDILSQRLANRQTEVHAEWSARPAAVLIPLFSHDGEWHTLFTERTDDVEEHQGQVSFPGGVIEEDDRDPTFTALRETFEEIGVSPDDVQVLGTLDTLLTVTQFEIVPVVGVIPWPYQFQINPSEVREVFGVPLHWLMDPENRYIDHRDPFKWGPGIKVHYFKPFEGHTIWGATARITLNLLEFMDTPPSSGA
jgi:8-oxo-dGTP pyrophosphatase MutT (NUDIX family)